MTVGLEADNDGRIALAAKAKLDAYARKATCLGCGPGIGRSDELDQLVCWAWRELPQPIVFDADGLNALASVGMSLAPPVGPRILTPHPGEFRRLAGKSEISVTECRQLAPQLAKRFQATLVLKGHRTMITDGDRIVENETGNPGMATGGSGDVLTGLIVGLLGHGMEPFSASTTAVHVHGLAGDIAAEELTETSMIASDIVRFLPAAFERIQDEQASA